MSLSTFEYGQLSDPDRWEVDPRKLYFVKISTCRFEKHEVTQRKDGQNRQLSDKTQFENSCKFYSLAELKYLRTYDITRSPLSTTGYPSTT